MSVIMYARRSTTTIQAYTSANGVGILEIEFVPGYRESLIWTVLSFAEHQRFQRILRQELHKKYVGGIDTHDSSRWMGGKLVMRYSYRVSNEIHLDAIFGAFKHIIQETLKRLYGHRPGWYDDSMRLCGLEE